MDRSITRSLQRLDVYLSRLKHDLETDNRSEALSNAAELAEVARRLWVFIADREGYSCAEAQMKLAAGGEN